MKRGGGDYDCRLRGFKGQGLKEETERQEMDASVVEVGLPRPGGNGWESRPIQHDLERIVQALTSSPLLSFRQR